MVIAPRRGTSRLGCLILLALLAAAAYLAVNLGGAYWRFYQFKDAMTQEANFAPRDSADSIAFRLRAQADSIGLPPEARNVHVRLTSSGITIWAEYSEIINLFVVERELDFEPLVQRRF